MELTNRGPKSGVLSVLILKLLFVVVFFGLKHEKAVLDHSQLKNLDMSQIKDGKKSQALKRALDEISEHIRNVKKRFGAEVLKKLKFERFDSYDQFGYIFTRVKHSFLFINILSL